jgi:hypothetical protein
VRRWTWDQAIAAGERIDQAYWRRAPIFWVGDADVEEIVYAVRKLIGVGRARHAV